MLYMRKSYSISSVPFLSGNINNKKMNKFYVKISPKASKVFYERAFSESYLYNKTIFICLF